jgi:hypothetical protein
MEKSVHSSTKKKSASNPDGAIGYVKDLLATKSEGLLGQGIHSGVGAALSRTALRSLPAPLNYVAPMVVEKLVVRHGVPLGRDMLLKGLRWVKKVTDEKPVPAM